ncbi:MAG: A24 family peptidase [Acetobacteraceae bacterium]
MEWVWPVLLAPFIGSFLGVLITRLPQGRPVVFGRSACDQCGTRLRARDLVPLLSLAVSGGRCRHCGGRIAALHWQVEAAAVVVAASAAFGGAEPPLLWLECGFGWALLALSWIDWEHMILPDALTLPLIPAGLLATLWLAPELAADHAVAAALGYTLLRGLALVYRRLRGRDGLGEGDAKLLAALGAWVGIEGLPLVLLGGALAGLAAALLLRLGGREMTASTALPFGPFLSLAAWLVLIAG